MKTLQFRDPHDIIMDMSDTLRADIKRSVSDLTDIQARYVLDRVSREIL